MTARVITVLCRIMLDERAAPLRRRIEAAEQLLDFEAPDEIVEEAKAFLTEIAEKGETPIDDKLSALKLLRRASAAKVVPARVTVRLDSVSIERHRALDTLRRRAALINAGATYPFPPGWDADLVGEDYVPTPSTDDEPTQSLAEALKSARLRVIDGKGS
jgi:AcrR family transcriptional regulator